MATNSGAYYEGLQYASQGVEPVKFGELAMGFAKIKEDQRLQEKREQEKREATQMEMTKLFGEEIYSAFDGTGLADVDVVNAKIKDSIVARANVLNSMYENGSLSNPQLMQEMVKLTAQSKKYANFANSISSKMSEIQELGGDVSEYTTLMLNNIDNLMKNATPVMDSSGNLSFLTKDGEEVITNPFSELEKLIDVRKKYDVDSVVDSVVKSKAKQKILRGGKVIEKYADVGQSDEVALRNIVGTLDAADKFDIAQRFGIPVQRDRGSVFKIQNSKEVDEGIVTAMKELAQSKLDQYTSVDEVEAKRLNIQLNQDYRAAKSFEQDNQGAVINVVGDKDDGQEVQVFPPAGKSVLVKSIMVNGNAVPTANIGRYIVDKDGNHKVTMSYATTVPAGVAGTKSQETKEVLITEDVTLTDPASINQVRSQFKMDPIKKVSTGTKKPKAY